MYIFDTDLCHTGLDENKTKIKLDAFLKSTTFKEITSIQRFLQKNQFPQPSANEPRNWAYVANIFGIVLQICDELEQHEEFPLSVNDAKKLHTGICKTIEFGLKPFLLQENELTKCCHEPNIIASVNALLKITNNKFFSSICSRNDQHLVYTDLLCSIFVLQCNAVNEFKAKATEYVPHIQSKLSHTEYFKILFLIKGSLNNRSNPLMQQSVHKQLMQTLYKSGSFFALSEALLPSITSLDQDEDIVKKRLHCCTVISSIIGKRGHKDEFYTQIIDEIYQHIMAFIQRNKSTPKLYYTDVGVQCLNKLCSLNKENIDRHIKNLFFRVFNHLAKPSDLIAGAVICEPDEFLEAIHAVHLTFCASGPSELTLPSDFLKPFIPLLMQLQYTIVDSTNKQLKEEIITIIIRCLSNREKSELNRIIEWVLYEEYDEGTKCLHPRIQIRRSIVDGNERITFNIAPIENIKDDDNIDLNLEFFIRSSSTLVNVLKQCNHNVLIYNIFLHLLEMFSINFDIASSEYVKDFKETTTSSSSELLFDENELQKSIENKFKKKYVVIHVLNELILFKSFHGQFAENPHDIISQLKKILNQHIKQIKSMVESNQAALLIGNYEEILMIILSIVEDLKARIQNDELEVQLYQTLKTLRILIMNIGEQKNILKKLDSVLDSNTNYAENTPFQEAKAILGDTHIEPYFKVYGIINMVKLISSRDEETCLSAHTVLALSLKLLREEDSYIFLNCIKLLVTLFEILEDTVLNALISEYHVDIDADSADIDFKLKVGETIIKVTEGIGEMCYKYKDTIINCFLLGSYNKNNEFRTSNMSNLGVIMRILCYQIHHIFQEVINAIVFFTIQKMYLLILSYR